MVQNWWQPAKSVFMLTSTINQATFNKSMLHKPPSHLLKRLCCWCQGKVQATWASEISWSCVSCWDLCHGPPSLSIIKHKTSERRICPKTMKSRSSPVESYEFTWSNKNQSVFVLHRDFPSMFNASSSKSNSSTRGTLHFTRQPRSYEVAPTLRQFHFQTSVSSILVPVHHL